MAAEGEKPYCRLKAVEKLAGLAQVRVRRLTVMLLDEPTSSLDLRWQLRVFETVRGIVRERGGLCLWSSPCAATASPGTHQFHGLSCTLSIARTAASGFADRQFGMLALRTRSA